MASADLRDELSCSLCLNVHTDPVTLRCGHNFCRVCIDRVLDTQVGSGEYSCPDCREEFGERPAPRKNVALCNIEESSLSTQPEQEKTGIFCTYCIQSPVPAVRSCLLCEASLCEDHLRVHRRSPEHVLSEPTTALGNRTVLQDKVGVLTVKVNMLFMDIRKQVDVLEKRVLSEVSRQTDQLPRPLCNLIRELEKKKRELSKKICLIEETCDMITDPATALQDQASDRGESFGAKDGAIESKCLVALCNLVEGLISEVLQTGFAEVATAAHNGIFMRYGSEILVDEDTAGNNLVVSGDLQSIYWTEIHQRRPKTPQRFKDHQVLSSTSFSTGRHFWIVETSKSGNWRLGVSYRTIDRKGFRSYIGCNGKSWGLCKWNTQYSVMHDCKEIILPPKFSCHRFGVYLDYEARQLSFYELCDPMRHLHTFTATFTEPLHAVFRLWVDSYGGAWIILRSNNYWSFHFDTN